MEDEAPPPPSTKKEKRKIDYNNLPSWMVKTGVEYQEIGKKAAKKVKSVAVFTRHHIRNSPVLKPPVVSPQVCPRRRGGRRPDLPRSSSPCHRKIIRTRPRHRPNKYKTPEEGQPTSRRNRTCIPQLRRMDRAIRIGQLRWGHRGREVQCWK